MGLPAEPLGRDPVDLFCRHVFQARLREVFPPGAQVLDLGGCADAEAQVLAERGVRVRPVATGDDLVKLGAGLDGAYASPGALGRVDLAPLGRALFLSLRPQAPVLFCLTGGRPPSLREIREQIGSGFRWRDAFALGVLLPGPSHAAWAARNPQAFALLAVLERMVRRWPVLRWRGRYVVVEGVRG